MVLVAWLWGLASRRGIRITIWIVLVLAAANSVVAIWQHFSPMDFPLPVIPGMNASRVLEKAPGGGYMAGGLVFHRLRLANLLALVIPCLVFAAPAAKGVTRWAVVINIVLAVPAMVFCYARTQLLSMIIGTGLCLLLMLSGRRSPGIRRLGLAGIVVLLACSAVIFTNPGVIARYSRGGLEDRMSIWSATIQAAAERPLTGHGLGTASSVLGDRLKETMPGFSAWSHNQFLTVLVTTGAIGLLLWLMLWLGIMRHAWKLASGRAETMGLLAGLVALQLISLNHDPFFHPITGITFASAAALSIAYSRRKND